MHTFLNQVYKIPLIPHSFAKTYGSRAGIGIRTFIANLKAYESRDIKSVEGSEIKWLQSSVN